MSYKIAASLRACDAQQGHRNNDLGVLKLGNYDEVQNFQKAATDLLAAMADVTPPVKNPLNPPQQATITLDIMGPDDFRHRATLDYWFKWDAFTGMSQQLQGIANSTGFSG